MYSAVLRPVFLSQESLLRPGTNVKDCAYEIETRAVRLTARSSSVPNHAVGTSLRAAQPRLHVRPVAAVKTSSPATEVGTTTELDAVQKHSEVVPDTVIFDDFERFPPTAATVTSSLLLGIASIPDARYKGAIESALAYGKCFVESKGPSRIACFMDKALVNVGAELSKLVPGRVSTEVDARLAHDTTGILTQVNRLLQLYDEVGVPRNRVLFKIPATWEGIEAARRLEAEGIPTHVTLVYSLAQAAACAEAGVSVIQIFVGRLRDWAKSNAGDSAVNFTVRSGGDAGLELVSRAYNYVHKGGYKSRIMAAALRNKQDVFALLGVDYQVVPVRVLQALKAAPADVDEEHSFQRRLAPTTAHAATFSSEEQGPWDKDRLNKSMGVAATQLLASGLESQVADIQRMEAYVDKIWPPPNV